MEQCKMSLTGFNLLAVDGGTILDALKMAIQEPEVDTIIDCMEVDCKTCKVGIKICPYYTGDADNAIHGLEETIKAAYGQRMIATKSVTGSFLLPSGVDKIFIKAGFNEIEMKKFRLFAANMNRESKRRDHA